MESSRRARLSTYQKAHHQHATSYLLGWFLVRGYDSFFTSDNTTAVLSKTATLDLHRKTPPGKISTDYDTTIQEGRGAGGFRRSRLLIRFRLRLGR